MTVRTPDTEPYGTQELIALAVGDADLKSEHCIVPGNWLQQGLEDLSHHRIQKGS